MYDDLSVRFLPLAATLIGLAGFGCLVWSSVLIFQDTGESTGPMFTSAATLGLAGLFLVVTGIVMAAAAVRQQVAFGVAALVVCVSAIPVAVVGYVVVLALFFS